MEEKEIVLMMDGQPYADVIPIEYKGQRVITLDQIDTLHKRPEGTAGRNFHKNKKRLVEGDDYFEFRGKEGREALRNLNSTNFVELKNSPHFVEYLFTESGYLMLVKSLTDDLAWKVQRMLVNSYFRAVKKNIQADPLDALQLIVDELKNQREKMNQLSEASAEVSARIDNVEKKIAGPDTGAKTLTEVARMSGFYSKNGNPHESFVKALLHMLKVKVTSSYPYDNEYSQCVYKSIGDRIIPVCYIKEVGQKILRDWLKDNSIEQFHSVNYYQRNGFGHKKGDIKESFYLVPDNAHKFYVFMK